MKAAELELTSVLSVRYGHSPESWSELWNGVLTTLRGEEFARDKVKVKAELRSSESGAALSVDGRPKIVHHMLYWSVEISP